MTKNIRKTIDMPHTIAPMNVSASYETTCLVSITITLTDNLEKYLYQPQLDIEVANR